MDIKFFFDVFCFGFVGGVLSCALLEVPLLTGILVAEAKHTSFTIAKKCSAFIIGMTISYMIIGYFFQQLAFVFNKHWQLSGLLLGVLGVAGIVWGLGLLSTKPHDHSCHDEHCHHDTTWSRFLKRFKPKTTFHFFILGLVFAWIETPVCPGCGPMLVMLASLTVIKGHIGSGFLTFGAYSLGQGFPVVLLSLLTHKGLSLETLSKLRPYMPIVIANALIFSGVVLLWLA